MRCLRETRKKITSVHKKMRNAVSKHKRSCTTLKNAMKRFLDKENPKEEIQRLQRELETITSHENYICFNYSDSLDEKVDKLNHSIHDIAEDIKEHAEDIMDVL